MEKKFIPQIDPWYGDAERLALDAYLKTGAWLTEFQKTEEFEKGIATVAQTPYASVVVNGTVALFIAFKAIGLKPGDEVIVPNLTMIATPNAVLLAGGTPVFVDINKESLCLDPEKVRLAITKKTKAVCHVSLMGRAGRLNELISLCKEKDLALIEDSAQAFGSYYDGRPLGSFGDIGIYSFTPHKIITTGQGGALVTHKKELYEAFEKVKDFGRMTGGGDRHDFIGWNFKFTDMQAVFGLEQLKTINQRIQKKRQIFSWYHDALSGQKGLEMIPTDLTNTTPWFIDIFVDKPTELAKFLKDKGIGSRLIYPAIHTQPIYAYVKGEFPVSSWAGSKGLWLPSTITLTKDDVVRITDEIKEFLSTT